MQVDTKQLRTRIEDDLFKLDELRSRLEARLKAVEIVERTASELHSDSDLGFGSALDSDKLFGPDQSEASDLAAG